MSQIGTNNSSKQRLIANIFRYICLVVIISPMFTSCSAYRINRLKNKSYKEWQAHQWNEVKKSSDKDPAKWTIHSRKVAGTDLLEYKIEGTIASSPEACMAAFRHDIRQQARNSNKFPTYDIEDESEDRILTYVIHNEPFPFKDTEMRVRYMFSNHEKGNTEVRWHEAWDEHSTPRSNLKRVETFRGSWQFSPAAENLSTAVNKIQFDPKGMPMWLVQPMVTKFLRNGLEGIRQTVSE